ncbi:WD repeat-containing protein 48 [Galendromus occidentalis]|uniref:WD repeat-containing protein 48 homolog n=1 Tax=Galendromus occidentalis TaxID=34638 RepID=A0AAJ7SEJ9_9ACAR|nr:WD repeat-containing protein 48 [Galendromus occidentalis]
MTASHKGSGAHCGSRKKTQLSFVIRDPIEREHRSGINSLQFDPQLNLLYSAGRDSIIRVWNASGYREPSYNQSMEHHTDWVNDIVLCCGGRYLISASSDTTVKVWNAHKASCLSTLRTHKDYVKALAYAKDQERVASAGLDKIIYLWDANTLSALSVSNNTVTTSSLTENKDSIYSVAMNSAGTIIVSGSTERVIRVWDPRTTQKLPKLKGHADNVRALVLNQDGTRCLSASSDGTIKLWSLGQQRCIETIQCHQEGVWALQVDPNFTKVYSGGRDKKVYVTHLSNPEISDVVCVEHAPILKMHLTNDGHLWVATTDSSLRKWSLADEKIGTAATTLERSEKKPVATIKGSASIRQCKVLNDKRHILTKDTNENVALYDVLRGSKEILGKIDFEAEVKKRFKMIYVPNWFTVDLKTGILCIHLEDPDCFAAWVSAREVGLTPPEGQDPKVNLGCLVLQSLFEYWPPAKDEEQHSLATDWPEICVPKHTPLILTDLSEGRTLVRMLVGDANREAEQQLLHDSLPLWATEVIVQKNMPLLIKIPFLLLPHNTSTGIKPLRRERLSAIDMLQVKKVIEHVHEKVIGQNSQEGGTATAASTAAATTAASTAASNVGASSMPAAASQGQVELLCHDQVLDPNMDLRTVKHFMWKSAGDLVLHFRSTK